MLKSLKNEKGSVMTVAVIMIALLSFSLTSVTAYTFRTAENTNRVIEDNTTDSNAKRLVSEALVRFEREINALVEEHGLEIYREFDDNYEDEAIIEEIEADLGVAIRLAPEKYDSEDVLEGVHARAYRIAYPISESREIVRYIYFTDYGVEYEEFDAFTYSIGSSENVVLNGGEYLESADVYGSHLYAGFSTAYKDSEGDYQVVEAGTYNFPSGDDATFTAPNYYEAQSGSLVLYADTEGRLVVDSDAYSEPAAPDGEFFSDLFMGFDFDRMFYNKLAELMEEDDDAYETGTFDDIENYFTQKKETAVIEEITEDITGTTDYTLDNSQVKFSDTHINLSGNTLDLNGNTLVILGDLTLQDAGAITSPGEIYVFGDVHLLNNRDLEMSANVFTTGEVTVDFDEGTGFNISQGQTKEGFGLFAKGNILFERNTTLANASGARTAIFILSESSVKMDSAIQDMHFGGAIYAQGKGDGLSDVLMEKDGQLEPFQGLLINSYHGTIDADTGETSPSDTDDDDGPGGGGGQGNPGVNPGGGGPPGNAAPGQEGNDHTFSFNALDESTAGSSPSDNLEESFSDLPDFERLVIVPNEGELTTEKSTYIYEIREDAE